MTRPLIKAVSTQALQQNWQSIRKQTHARQLLATVKSNAYGHGLATVVKALSRHCNGYAVIDINDAIEIRTINSTLPIILLQGIFKSSDIQAIAQYRLTPVIHSHWQISPLTSLASDSTLTIYIKVNTGMNRLGFKPQDVPSVINQLQQNPAIDKLILATHFANADADANATSQQTTSVQSQLDTFNQLRQSYPHLAVSIGNSASTLLHDIDDDWARIGIALYGACPAPEYKTKKGLGFGLEFGLVPVMTLKSEIIAIYTIKTGQTVGYGSTFTAPKDMTIGIVSIGYGDGYPRCNNLVVQCCEQLCSVIGRVSMEMITIDLSAIPAAAVTVGSSVILWGDKPTVDDIARAANTIAYDLLTACSHLPTTAV